MVATASVSGLPVSVGSISVGAVSGNTAGTIGVAPTFVALNGSLDPSKGSSTATFARASSGTYMAPNGYMETAITDVERFENGYLLMEPASTNDILYSNKFDEASWVAPNWSFIVTQGEPDIAGGTDAWRLELDADLGGTPEVPAIGQILGANIKGCSVWLKDGSTPEDAEFFISIFGDITTTMPKSNQWTKIEASGTGISNLPVFGMYSASNSFSPGDYFYVCFAQAEQDWTNPTSTIVTTVAPVTRARDTLSLSTSSPTPFGSPLTYAVDLIIHNYPIVSDSIYTVYCGVNTATIVVYADGSIGFVFGASSDTSAAGVITTGEQNRIVLTADASTVDLYVSGVLVASAAHAESELLVTSIDFGGAATPDMLLRDFRSYPAYCSTAAEARNA